jgi:hypothetical protein
VKGVNSVNNFSVLRLSSAVFFILCFVFSFPVISIMYSVAFPDYSLYLEAERY